MRRTLFDSEHADFRESARRFVAEEVLPHLKQWEADGIVARELFATAAAKGMLGIQVPERFGGAGIDDFRFNQIVGEELGVAGAGGSGLGLTLHNDICLPYFL
jgi:alkylation response protein AidB-like acyl-CoA dehydrogenase